MTRIVPIDDRLFRLDVLHEAARLAHVDPVALTDLHLAHVAVYSANDAVAYALKRDRAIEHVERTKALAAYQTTAVASPPAADAWPTKAEGLEAWMERCPTVPTPLGVFKAFTDSLQDFVLAMNERNKERNGKIAALEATVAELKNQIVELLADQAVKK